MTEVCRLLSADPHVNAEKAMEGQTPGHACGARWKWAVGIVTVLVMAGVAMVWSGRVSETPGQLMDVQQELTALDEQSVYFEKAGGNCPTGEEIMDADECLSAAKALNLWNRWKGGSADKATSGHGHVPPGCWTYLAKNGCWKSKVCNLGINTKKSGKNNGNYRALCKEKLPAANLFPIVATYLFKGTCSGGVNMGKNVRVASACECETECMARDGCGYFAYASNKKSGSNCNVFWQKRGCKKNGQYQQYATYSLGFSFLHHGHCAAPGWMGHDTSSLQDPLTGCEARCRGTVGCGYFGVDIKQKSGSICALYQKSSLCLEDNKQPQHDAYVLNPLRDP